MMQVNCPSPITLLVVWCSLPQVQCKMRFKAVHCVLTAVSGARATVETRAESIGAYGHPFVKTPHLDSLAKEGALFQEAHVLHTQCAPSRCAMITGRYMHVLGHRTQDHLVREYEPNYFRLLKDSGYHILWHGKNDMFSQVRILHNVGH